MRNKKAYSMFTEFEPLCKSKQTPNQAMQIPIRIPTLGGPPWFEMHRQQITEFAVHTQHSHDSAEVW